MRLVWNDLSFNNFVFHLSVNLPRVLQKLEWSAADCVLIAPLQTSLVHKVAETPCGSLSFTTSKPESPHTFCHEGATPSLVETASDCMSFVRQA